MAGLLDAERFDSAANVAADIDFMSGSGSPDGTPRRSLSHTVGASYRHRHGKQPWMQPAGCAPKTLCIIISTMVMQASFEAAERVWMLPVPCDAVLNSAHASPASKVCLRYTPGRGVASTCKTLNGTH